MELYKDEFVTYCVYPEKGLMEEYYTEETENMTTEILKELMRKLVGFWKIYKPTYYYSDMQHFKYPISPEMQKWVDQNIATKAIEYGMKKTARLMSQDFIAQLSIKQLTEEKAYAESIINKFFDNEKDAKDWLFS